MLAPYDLNAEPYSEEKTYEVNAQCIYNNGLYRAKVLVDKEEWVDDYWELLLN